MQQSRRVKAVRGSITATFAVAVALLFHVLAGGALPGPAGILIPLALALPVCVAVSVSRLSLLRLSVSVSVSQALFHTLFVFGTVPFAEHSGHQHGAVSFEGAQLPASAAHVHGGHLPGAQFDTTTMVLAHVIAAAITVLALHRGERAIRAVLGAAKRVILRAVRIAQPPKISPAPKPMPLNPHVSVTPRLCPLRQHARRGPPAVLFH